MGGESSLIKIKVFNNIWSILAMLKISCYGNSKLIIGIVTFVENDPEAETAKRGQVSS